MNWLLSALDRFQLISNSDAHSPAKLGREANLLDTELSYAGLKRAVETGNGLAGTIEFFPEEGKYHFDGHRKCHICMSPLEAESHGGICPVCKKKMTMGVSHRIDQLADRPEGFLPERRKPFESLVPLPEVIANATGRSEASKRPQALYEELPPPLGPAFALLREVPNEGLGSAAGPAGYGGFGEFVARCGGKVGEGYFEALLRELFLDNDHGACAEVVPTESDEAAEEAGAATEREAAAELTEDDGTLTFATGKVTLVVDKDPINFKLLAADGSELYSTLPGNPFVKDANNRVVAYSRMKEDDCFYGFGEKTGLLDKNKTFQRERATDAMGYDAEKMDTLYKHIPFYIRLDRDTHKAVGVFYHNFYESVFNMGCEKSNYWPRYT